ncbi:hypothetical protein [Halobacterium sp. R2-5]|uniref:DUF7344 domain-containing protein n=1 Tax=Halobacterium sp. R2-5 TaxID=2715751 RepID=UPI001421AAA2|nr:hypothetical protein [Halobacterium sp. R2-5]NIC01034.1 hypothetical protein [Halobacterium sp. R2-5]
MNLRRLIPTTSNVSDRPSIDLETDEVYRILSARRRRLVLLQLANLEAEKVTLEELARAVAAKETGAAAFDIPSDAYKAAYVSLHQSHAPVLDEHDIVEWDSDHGVLRLTPTTSALAEVIRDVCERTQ